MPDLQPAVLGRSPVFRIGRVPDPLAPPDWRYAQPDGTFGGRFDDPRGRRGVPSSGRYRVLYLASHPSAAFAETVARFRPSLETTAQIGGHTGRGIISREWRAARRIGATVVFSELPCVDLEHADTLQALRPVLAPVAARLGVEDIDLGAMAGPQREVTQEAAWHIYQQRDVTGRPLFAGLRYVSRLNAHWECWAIFADRLRQRRLKVELISADDPHLYEAARLLNLAVQTDRGGLIVPS